MKEKYVQYGCGLSAPAEWLNFDVSPTLRIQKIPVLGAIMKKRATTIFPANVRYGDIVLGLPVADNSCDGVYCSHTLEHLSLEDFRKALHNTYRILKPGGTFRCVVPDLEIEAKLYLESLEKGKPDASVDFIDNILLGQQKRPRGMGQLLRSIFGNAHHLWMWDGKSLEDALKKTGFKNVRLCQFGDSPDLMFTHVESEARFWHAAAVEGIK